jgi:magnesium transporter
MITAYRWHAENKACERLGPEALAGGGGEIIWVDLESPTPEEEAAVFDRFFHVHPLSLEDVTYPRSDPDGPPHLPKAEEFPDYLLVIVNPLNPGVVDGLRAGKEPSDAGGLTTQLSAVLTGKLLITHHYGPLAGTAELHAYLGRHEAQGGRGPDYLFHIILDATVDQYAPVLDQVEDDLDQIEVDVFTRPSPPLLARLLHLKRTVIGLRKTLVYEREVLARLARGEFDLISHGEAVYYRNVYDHLVRFTELIEGAREMVSDLMQTHLAAASNRLNEIMKVLTMISTVVLPMTLIAGIYGMNFKGWFPELEWPCGYPWALGLMLLSGLASLAFFRWKKWL